MPTKKISELPEDPPASWKKAKIQPCLHPDHGPSFMIVREPGIYEHVCPGCGRRITFRVNRPVPGTCAHIDMRNNTPR